MSESLLLTVEEAAVLGWPRSTVQQDIRGGTDNTVEAEGPTPTAALIALGDALAKRGLVR